MLQAGDKAPLFTLPDADGVRVALRDLLDGPVVLYFYPKDDTPGCTTQACGIRDAWSEFEAAGATVVGISPDDVASHARFRDKFDLPHLLLADPDRKAIDKYGAWGEKKMYGRTYEGVLRSTFLVGADGRIARVWPKARPKQHAEEVLAALAELSG